MAISPDARIIAVALGDDTIRLLDAASGKERGKAGGIDANGVAFSPDGTMIAVAGHDNDVRIINTSGKVSPHRTAVSNQVQAARR